MTADSVQTHTISQPKNSVHSKYKYTNEKICVKITIKIIINDNDNNE